MSDSGPAAGSGPGQRFSNARDSLGLAEEDVADALNLPLRVIVDLEAEAWENLPAAAFTRGYIRAYAKLLDLDSDELVADYEGDVGPAQTVELELPAAIAARSSGSVADLLKGPRVAMFSRAVIGIVSVVLIAWLIWPDGGEQPTVVVLEPGNVAVVEPSTREPGAETVPVETATPEMEAALPSPDLESAATEPTEVAPAPELNDPRDETPEVRLAEPEVATGDPESGAEDVRTVLPATAAAPAPSGPVPVNAPEAEISLAGDALVPGATTTKSRRITETGDDRLRLRFSDDCWVEVKDSGNRNLYGDLGRSGETLELIGEAPFRVLLGYAPGVDLAYNGEPVVLADYTRNNVAALWLGRR